MRRIILASRSKARQAILKQIGLKFRAVPSSAKETRILKKRCSDLVIANALKKAEDVAKKFTSGIVIGADTVVLVKGKIIGKPKSKKEAFKILKFLFKEPQWVYTGLAVIDINKNKAFTTYDKTKVYMQRLNNRQVRNYFKKVSPLDKAGAFDIQGLGSIFIDHIEGCFYNAVGLPIAKLAKILKKTEVEIFK